MDMANIAYIGLQLIILAKAAAFVYIIEVSR